MSDAGLGCCADGECTSETCMRLPAGQTCSTCVHARRCVTSRGGMFGAESNDDACGFFPRRFREREDSRRARSAQERITAAVRRAPEAFDREPMSEAEREWVEALGVDPVEVP